MESVITHSGGQARIQSMCIKHGAELVLKVVCEALLLLLRDW